MKPRFLSLASHYDAAWLLLLATTYLLPLAMLPMAADSFVIPKETLVAVALVLALALTIAWTLVGNGKLSLKLDPLNGAVLAFAAWNWLSVLWAAAPVLAIENATRLSIYTGVFFLFQLVAGGYRSRVAWIFASIGSSSLILAGWTLVQDFRAGFHPTTLAVRAVLGDWRDALAQVGLGNTSHLGDALVLGFLCWVGTLALAGSRRLKLVAVASLVLHAGALIVTWSVHSNISLILAGAILLYTAWDKGPVRRLVRRGRSLIVALLIGWAAITAFYVLDLPVSPHSSAVWSPKEEPEMGGIFGQAFSSSRWTSGLDTRKAIWLNTLEIVRHHPWLGTGVGTFTWVYPATISPIVQNDEALSAWSGSWTNAAHQELLQTWAELGIVGAALLVVMVSLSIRLYWTRLRGGASGATSVLLAVGIAGLVAILFQCQMNFPLRMPTGTFHFFLFLVIPLLLPRSAGESWDLDVPVERPYGPFNVGIMMRNMAYPTELSLRISLESLPARALAAVVLALGLVLLVPISAPLRADLAYRQVRETKLRAGQGVGSIDRVIPLADKVLAVWPGHVDCRSARQDALLATGKFQEVIDETPLVLEKLNAVEVRLRRALALDALGKTGESTEDWREVFRRRPELAVQFPEPWQRVRPATTSSK